MAPLVKIPTGSSPGMFLRTDAVVAAGAAEPQLAPGRGTVGLGRGVSRPWVGLVASHHWARRTCGTQRRLGVPVVAVFDATVLAVGAFGGIGMAIGLVAERRAAAGSVGTHHRWFRVLALGLGLGIAAGGGGAAGRSYRGLLWRRRGIRDLTDGNDCLGRQRCS